MAATVMRLPYTSHVKEINRRKIVYTTSILYIIGLRQILGETVFFVRNVKKHLVFFTYSVFSKYISTSMTVVLEAYRYNTLLVLMIIVIST